MIRKILVGFAVLVGLAVASWFWVGGSAGIIEKALPPFPQFPPPAVTLSADDHGILYFETSTP